MNTEDLTLEQAIIEIEKLRARIRELKYKNNLDHIKNEKEYIKYENELKEKDKMIDLLLEKIGNKK